MGRLRAATLLLAALAAGLLLAACGSDSSNELLPGTTAKQIESNLDQVRSNAGEGNCEAAEEAVAEVSTEIDGLQKVDKELKKALKQGAAKLSELVSSCGVKEEEEEQAKAEKEEEVEEEEQAALEAEEDEAAEEEAEKEQKAEERDEKAKEKAEKHAEQPGPSEEGEESGPKGHEEEEIEPPTEEEVTPPTEGGAAGGIGPGAEVEGTP
jgi:outer membrane biosynthesis protein TonB